MVLVPILSPLRLSHNKMEKLKTTELTSVTVISFWFLPRKSAFVEDFSDILTINKFNKKIGSITPTSYLNSLIPNYQITLINTLLKNKSAAKVSGTDLQQSLLSNRYLGRIFSKKTPTLAMKIFIYSLVRQPLMAHGA